MGMTITVTPLEGERTKGIANIHYGKKLSATVFIKQNENGELYVSRPGYETKKVNEQTGKNEWVHYFNTIGEGSLTSLNNKILEEYDRMLVGGERAKVEDLEINKIEVVNVFPRKLENNPYEKGVATIKINDEIMISNIKIVNSKNGLFVAFPSSYDREKGESFPYIEALADIKVKIRDSVLEAYNKTINENKDKEKTENAKSEEKNKDNAEKNNSEKKKSAR